MRLIVGDRVYGFPKVLKPGIWQHLAVVIDRGMRSVYLDGKKIQASR